MRSSSRCASRELVRSVKLGAAARSSNCRACAGRRNSAYGAFMVPEAARGRPAWPWPLLHWHRRFWPHRVVLRAMVLESLDATIPARQPDAGRRCVVIIVAAARPCQRAYASARPAPRRSRRLLGALECGDSPCRLAGMTNEKDTFQPRISFSHARTKPLVVEKIKRRVPAPTALLCPTCGAKMKLAPSAGSKLTASCPNCTP